MIRQAKYFLVLGAAVILAGCNSGSVVVANPDAKDGRVYASPLIMRLEKVPEETGRKLLEGLAGPKGYHFEWQDFWVELSARPSRHDLVAKYREPLLTLHSQECSAYLAFVRFVLSVGDGFEYVLTDQRRCQHVLPPSMALSVARQADRFALSDRFKLLLQELTKDKYAAWIESIRPFREWLQKSGDQLIREGNTDEFSDFIVSLTEVSGGIALPQMGQDRIFTESKILDRLFASRGKRAIEILAQIAQLNTQPTSFAFTHAQLQPLVALIHKQPLENSALVTDYQRRKELILALGAGWEPRQKLTFLTSLQQDLQRSIQSMPGNELEVTLRRAFEATENNPVLLDFAWVSARLLPRGHAVREQYQKRLEKPLVLIENVDQILRARMDVVFSHAGNRLAKMKRFCDTLENDPTRIRKEAVAPDELQRRLETGLAPGCYFLETSEKEIKMDLKTPATATFDSLIETKDTALKIKSPAVELGMVLLRTTEHPDDLPLTPTPPSSDARVVPILVGLSIPKATPALAKASHFFIFHYIDKLADEGKRDPKAAQAGFDGPSLTLDTLAAPGLFPFLSVGGPGQKGAPRRPGGRGDDSWLDIDQLSDWVSLQAENGKLGAGLERPVKTHPRMSLRTAEELLVHAKRNEDSQPLVYIIPDYWEQMQQRERAKLALICERLLDRRVLESDMGPCLQAHIAPRALAQLRELLVEAEKDNRIDKTLMHPRLDGIHKFSLPAAADGPLNTDGPQGRAGNVDLNLPKPGEKI